MDCSEDGLEWKLAKCSVGLIEPTDLIGSGFVKHYECVHHRFWQRRKEFGLIKAGVYAAAAFIFQ